MDVFSTELGIQLSLVELLNFGWEVWTPTPTPPPLRCCPCYNLCHNTYVPWCGMWKWKISTCSSLSFTISLIPKSGGSYSQHCATQCAHIVRTKTAHKLVYLYMYWRVILLVGTVFVWAKCNVEVCLVVFLVRLVAQWAVRSTVNFSVREGNFTVL
jgi:hypothetical protein